MSCTENGDSKLYLNDEDCEGIVQVDLSPTVGDEAVIVQYIPQTESSPFESLTCVAEDDVYGMVATAALIGLGVGLGVALSGDPVPAAPDFGSLAEPPAPLNPPDTAAPTAPVISGITDNVGAVQGPVASGGSTDDTTPTVNGSGATPGDTVTLYDGATVIGSTTVAPDGTWSVTPGTPLPEGNHNLTVTATDPAGNKSTSSDPYVVIVDTTAPSTGDGKNSITFNDGGDELLSGTEATNVTLSGQVEAGATVTGVSITDGSTVLTVAAADISVSGGVVSIAGQDLSAFNDGTMSVTDAAGNSGAITDTTVLDSTAPTVPAIGSVADDVGAMQGTIANGGSNDDTQPTVNGSGAVPGDTITLYDGAAVIGSTTVAPGGTWSITPGVPLTESSHSFTATATDPAAARLTPLLWIPPAQAVQAALIHRS